MTNPAPPTPQQIRAESPFPWRYVTFPQGRVVVIDANNKEVPMFAVLEMACRYSREPSMHH